jgi:hypothetical protein
MGGRRGLAVFGNECSTVRQIPEPLVDSFGVEKTSLLRFDIKLAFENVETLILTMVKVHSCSPVWRYYALSE